ncbi:hypothetical protein PZB75_16080 [Streptomyces sp. AM 4-1-1]|uniref:hypothetical protein n=1 Tax=Streptomyces sp. AM 4-1-1 TaxID=3028710 RepID=UPI0023B99DFF|nr:hypothetical protein [Streptomyces sp. AM 4-1-1]WEH34735.1 hypothetical protein PZB75_16080 [Streptomyces sp. AM 4-1-1]
MAIAIVDAVRLAKTNRRRYERLLECQEELNQRAAAENAAQRKARQTLYDEALVPFRDVFQRLKRVDLVELAAIDMPSVGGEVDFELQRLRERAVTAAVGALAGGALAGSGAGVGAYLAVGAFASASTGTAISGLSGAAATSATLAWMGGGSVAAGGGGVAAGTTVLSLIIAAPAVLSLAAIGEWQSRRLRRGEQEKAQALERYETEMSEAEDAASAVYDRSKAMRHILRDLRFMMVRRLPSFTGLVEACDDFARYDSGRRAEVAAMVDLAGLAVMVMGCPITDADGRMTEESGQVVADAESRLQAMETVS